MPSGSDHFCSAGRAVPGHHRFPGNEHQVGRGGQVAITQATGARRRTRSRRASAPHQHPRRSLCRPPGRLRAWRRQRFRFSSQPTAPAPSSDSATPPPARRSSRLRDDMPWARRPFVVMLCASVALASERSEASPCTRPATSCERLSPCREVIETHPGDDSAPTSEQELPSANARRGSNS